MVLGTTSAILGVALDVATVPIIEGLIQKFQTKSVTVVRVKQCKEFLLRDPVVSKIKNSLSLLRSHSSTRNETIPSLNISTAMPLPSRIFIWSPLGHCRSVAREVVVVKNPSAIKKEGH
jgi:hypothetical protein